MGKIERVLIELAILVCVSGFVLAIVLIVAKIIELMK